MAHLPNKVSDAFIRRNPEFYGRQQALDPLTQSVKVPLTPKKQIIRVSKSQYERLNKTERRFLEWLRWMYPTDRIGIQDIMVRIAADCRLTPDFSRWTVSQKPKLYDVKGPHRWEDSIIKLKTAAAMFKMFEFYLAYEVDGQWHTQPIPP